MQESTLELPQAHELATLSHLGSFKKAYREPGLLLFAGAFLVSGFLGIALILSSDFAILGILCLGFALMSLIAAIGHFYPGRVSLYFYTDGFVQLKGNAPLVVRWDETDTLEHHVLPPRSYSYSHIVTLTNDTRLSFMKAQGEIIERYYFSWLMERWQTGETLNFGAIALTSNAIHIKYVPSERTEEIDEIIAWDDVETLWIGENEDTLLLLLRATDSNQPSQQRLIPLAQIRHRDVLIRLVNDILADEAWKSASYQRGDDAD